MARAGKLIVIALVLAACARGCCRRRASLDAARCLGLPGLDSGFRRNDGGGTTASRAATRNFKRPDNDEEAPTQHPRHSGESRNPVRTPPTPSPTLATRHLEPAPGGLRPSGSARRARVIRWPRTPEPSSREERPCAHRPAGRPRAPARPRRVAASHSPRSRSQWRWAPRVRGASPATRSPRPRPRRRRHRRRRPPFPTPRRASCWRTCWRRGRTPSSPSPRPTASSRRATIGSSRR